MSNARKDDGGPAFPVPLEGCQWASDQHGSPDGMSLRDFFAAAALPAVIERCARDKRAENEAIEHAFATLSYAVADAMLEVRKL